VTIVFLCAGVLLVKMLLTDDGQKRRRQVQTVTLLKPPPPPKIKEKPPEPEVKKEDKIIEPEVEELPQDDLEDQAEDDASMDDELGLDSDGSAGSDGFGLKAKKGGRSLIGGSSSLLGKYAWYTQIIQTEIRKKVDAYMERNGGLPEGELQTFVQLLLDDEGNIVSYRLYHSSGNPDMDAAVEEALRLTKISEPPPAGMPREMKVKISSKG
jgi:TonB family protein